MWTIKGNQEDHLSKSLNKKKIQMAEIKLGIERVFYQLGSFFIGPIANAREVFRLTDRFAYLVEIDTDMLLKITPLGLRTFPSDAHTLLFDDLMYDIAKGGIIDFGTFRIDGVDVIGMEGIGISDIMDIKPSGGAVSKLVHTFNIPIGNKVKFTRRGRRLEVKLDGAVDEKPIIVHIRIR
jgi:hypothetical protein